jgi:hypothetical protein
MHPLHLQAEQVGFVNLGSAPPRLDMMGGEFCLNAARCLGFAMAYEHRFLPLAGQDDFFGLLSCSGCPEALQVRIKNGNRLFARHAGNPPVMPLECFVSLAYKAGDFTLQESARGVTLVRLPGISHLLLDERIRPVPENVLVAAAEWLRELNLENEGACGVVWHRQDGGSTCRIIPVVHVAATASSVLESACGSGSLALALALAQKDRQDGKPAGIELAVVQPSEETLYVRLKMDDSPERSEVGARGTASASFACAAEIGGIVRLCARGEVFV